MSSLFQEKLGARLEKLRDTTEDLEAGHLIATRIADWILNNLEDEKKVEIINIKDRHARSGENIFAYGLICRIQPPETLFENVNEFFVNEIKQTGYWINGEKNCIVEGILKQVLKGLMPVNLHVYLVTLDYIRGKDEVRVNIMLHE